MNTLDVIILIVILIPALFGLKRGLIKSVFTLISIIAGLITAVKFHTGVSVVLGTVIKDVRILDPVSFILIILLFYLIGLFLAEKISKTGFVTETLNKIGGFFFGGLKGALFLSIIFIIAGTSFFITESQIKKSLFYAPVISFAPNTYNAVKSVLPFSKKDFYELTKFFYSDSLKTK